MFFAHKSNFKKASWVIFLALVAIAIYRRFALPLLPFADQDTGGYLDPALSFLEKGTFIHANGRSFPYPLFVLVVASIGQSLKAVVVVQHLLGLVAGFLVYALWDLPVFEKINQGFGRLLVFCAQLLTAGYYLSSFLIIEFEHTLRPESVACFLMVLLVFLLVKLIGLETKNAKGAFLSSVLLFLNLLLYVVIPRWGLATFVLLLFLLAYIYQAKISKRLKWVYMVLPITLFFATVYVPERYLVAEYDVTNDVFLPKQFFYAHLDLIKPLIEEDIASPTTTTVLPKPILQKFCEEASIKQNNDQRFLLLGFNPDNYMYGAADSLLEAMVRADFSDNFIERSNVFFKTYDVRLIRERPIAYAQKVSRQLKAAYFLPENINQFPYEKLGNSIGDCYGISIMSMQNDGYKQSMIYRDYMDGLYKSKEPEKLDLSILNYLTLGLKYTFGPVVLLFVVGFVFRRFSKGMFKDNKVIAPLGFLNMLLLLLHLGLVSTVALIHTFDMPRYGGFILPVSLLLYAFSLLYILLAAMELMRGSLPKLRVVSV